MKIRSSNTAIPTLKRLMRLIGTLGGLFAATMLPISAAMLADAISNRERAGFLFPIMFLIVDLYLLWLCYYVWFKFSPRAVLHICGLLGVLALGLPNAFLPANLDGLWPGLIHLLWILIVIWSYRRLSAYLNRLIFNPVTPPLHAV